MSGRVTMNVAIVVAAITLLLSLYGALHYYAFRKLRVLFPNRRRALAATLVLLWASLIVVELLTHGNGSPAIATPLAWISFTWMGLAFLFFAISVPLDLLGAVARFFRLTKLHLTLAAPRRSLVVAAIAALIATNGIFSSQQVTVHNVTLDSPKLQRDFGIVQISDLHLGLMTRESGLRDMVNAINPLKPDLIVITGDLVDMQLDHVTQYADVLSSLQARLGKYAVLGNHEAFAGLDASRVFIQRAGFELLSNSGITVSDNLNLVGVDDPAVENRVTTSGVNELAALQPFANGLYTVLLKHQPIVAPEALGRVDLQLSGHTHGGQVFPFGLLTRLVYRAPFGLSEFAPDQWLYVSRGTGTWGPPMRVLAKPEITWIRLTRTAPDSRPSPS